MKQLNPIVRYKTHDYIKIADTVSNILKANLCYMTADDVLFDIQCALNFSERDCDQVTRKQVQTALSKLTKWTNCVIRIRRGQYIWWEYADAK